MAPLDLPFPVLHGLPDAQSNFERIENEWPDDTAAGAMTAYGRVITDIAATGSMANVTGLSFAIGASEVWSFEVLVYTTNPSANLFSFQLTGPASPAGVLLTLAAGSVQNEATAFSSPVNGPTGGTLAPLRGTIVNGSNAGTVQVQFKESGTPAGHAKAGSYLLATKGS